MHCRVDAFIFIQTSTHKAHKAQWKCTSKKTRTVSLTETLAHAPQIIQQWNFSAQMFHFSQLHLMRPCLLKCHLFVWMSTWVEWRGEHLFPRGRVPCFVEFPLTCRCANSGHPCCTHVAPWWSSTHPQGPSGILSALICFICYWV